MCMSVLTEVCILRLCDLLFSRIVSASLSMDKITPLVSYHCPNPIQMTFTTKPEILAASFLKLESCLSYTYFSGILLHDIKHAVRGLLPDLIEGFNQFP